MTRTLTFSVEGTPRPQGSTRAIVTKTGQAVVVNARRESLGVWRADVREAAHRAVVDEGDAGPYPGPVALDLSFFLTRPKAHYRTDGTLRPSAPELHDRRPDVDKLARAVLDALTGVLYVDDAQVCRLNACRFWAETWRGPALVVRVEQLVAVEGVQS